MKKETMIKNYRKFSAANAYILGFEYKHSIYYIMVNEIPPRYMTVERESSKKGGAQKLQLRLKKAYKEQLIRKGATYMGGEEILIGEYNKGVEFERLISEMNGQAFRGKENLLGYGWHFRKSLWCRKLVRYAYRTRPHPLSHSRANVEYVGTRKTFTQSTKTWI